MDRPDHVLALVHAAAALIPTAPGSPQASNVIELRSQAFELLSRAMKAELQSQAETQSAREAKLAAIDAAKADINRALGAIAEALK